MTKKQAKNKDQKTQIDRRTWVLVAFAAVALILVIIAIINFTKRETYDSSYFHDAEGRIVLTMDRDTAALDDSIYEPNITHIVYYYEGNSVTNVKAFYEYLTEDEAKIAYEHLDLGTFAVSKSLNGRFIVFEINRAMYKDLTVETLKSDVESMKSIDGLILDYNENTIKNYSALTFGSE